MNKRNVDKWFAYESKWAREHFGEKLNVMKDFPEGIDPDNYFVGNADYGDRETLMLLIEAARHLCAVDHVKAKTLLVQALGKL
jgi:hypothetical protein